MKLTKDTKYAIGALLGVGAIVATYYVFRTPPLKPIYEAGETMNVVQGHPFTVRFPRGDYSVGSPDIMIQAQNDLGNETHVVLVTPVSPMGEPITIKTVIVEQDSGKPYPIEIVARPVTAYGALPQAVPA